VANTDTITVAGAFEELAQARHAIEELRRAGFGRDQIGWVHKDHSGGSAPTVLADTTPEQGAAVGAVAGGSLGGLIGAALALTIPGAGPILAAGVLAGVLGGAAVGIAGGGLVGALIAMGLSDDDANYFDREVQAGRTLVTVKAGPRYEEAAEILNRCGATSRYSVPTTAGA